MEIRRQQQQGILPSQRFQLAHDCLVSGIRPVYGPATVGQVTKIKGFTGCSLVHRIYFCVLVLSMICKCLSKMQIDQEYKSIHNVMHRFLPLVLNSLTSKSHTTRI